MSTPTAFFIQDSGHEVFDGYPLSGIDCGDANEAAYRKLYSVFPDVFDFATLMPGMQLLQRESLGENVPYSVPVSNRVRNIGLPLFDRTATFGSSGRLMNAVFNSFGCIEILTHELGHTWGMALGRGLGLSGGAHWSDHSDINGQMSGYFFSQDLVGSFSNNGDGTWRLVRNAEVIPYSPLELYAMGLLPPSEVPDVHILKDPDVSDPMRVTAKSLKTIPMAQILKDAGGERIPSVIGSQKDFTLAFIVAQDTPFNGPAYVYFSLLSRELMSLGPPDGITMTAPFTGRPAGAPPWTPTWAISRP